MSEIKHTPEPVATIGSTWQLLWVGEGSFSAIVEKHGLKIGDMLYAGSVADAAPELLEALQTMVKRIEFYSGLPTDERPNIEQWEYTEGSTDMKNARAAIAKAEGRS